MKSAGANKSVTGVSQEADMTVSSLVSTAESCVFESKFEAKRRRELDPLDNSPESGGLGTSSWGTGFPTVCRDHVMCQLRATIVRCAADGVSFNNSAMLAGRPLP